MGLLRRLLEDPQDPDRIQPTVGIGFTVYKVKIRVCLLEFIEINL